MNNRNQICLPGDPGCSAPSAYAHDTVSERTAAAIRNILSGDTSCARLVRPDGSVDREHLDRSVRVVMQTYEDEKNELLRDRALISRESEERRQILELVYSNAIGLLPPDIADRVCRALGLFAG